ncbi:MAG: translation elongation factor Ts [Planctomycetaceae bacterium]|nr:translation elongation factor Ts [Planctomycetaceae bacterium]
MAEITAEAVRALRAKTDLPLMDCKRALTEANGDENLAIDILRKQGLKVAGKRADNATNEGRFFVAAKADGSEAALVEMLCESAPVAKSDDFLNFGNACAQQVLNGPGAENGEALLTQPNPAQTSQTLGDLLLDVINRIREKIVVGRVWKVTGPVGGYVHHDGKTAALFQASGSGTKLDILKDVAMHITAMRPSVTLSSELDTSIVAVEKNRLIEEAAASGKPANIIEKMVEGRMKVFYAEKGSLADQLFAKDDTKTVAKALAEAGFTAVGFKRVVLGQA